MADRTNLRILGADFSRIDHLHIHASFVNKVLQHFDDVDRVFALIPGSQGRRGILGKPKVIARFSLQIQGRRDCPSRAYLCFNR